MKKYVLLSTLSFVFLGIISMVYFIPITNSYQHDTCVLRTTFDNMNSKDLYDYSSMNHSNYKITEICTPSICYQNTYWNQKSAINHITKDYEQHLKKQNKEEEAIEISLKGFKISSITYDTCN